MMLEVEEYSFQCTLENVLLICLYNVPLILFTAELTLRLLCASSRKHSVVLFHIAPTVSVCFLFDDCFVDLFEFSCVVRLPDEPCQYSE